MRLPTTEHPSPPARRRRRRRLDNPSMTTPPPPTPPPTARQQQQRCFGAAALGWFVVVAAATLPAAMATTMAATCALPCHLVRAEALHDVDVETPYDRRLSHTTNETSTASSSSSTTTTVQCITTTTTSTTSATTTSPTTYRRAYDIDLPAPFLQKHAHALETGALHVCLTDHYHNFVVDDEHGRIHLTVAATTGSVQADDDDDDDSTLPSKDTTRDDDDDDDTRRTLQYHANRNNHYTINPTAHRRGTKRLLAVRVSSTYGETPDESVEAIRAALFGSDNDTTNPDHIPADASVAAQYEGLTHGQLRYIPAVGRADHHRIDGGVTDITIHRKITGTDVQSGLVDEMLRQTGFAVGGGVLSDTVDNIVFCLPTGGTFEGQDTWTAFTYLYEPYSYYQQSRCTRLSVVAHELGHSLGFQHSGNQEGTYADKTGYMGFAVNMLGYPKKAFNGHKHWISGWLADRAYVVNPSEESVVRRRLVSFVDYTHENLQFADAVLLQTGNFYIQYNKAKGYNADSFQPNSVTVTQASSADEVSMNVANLYEGESYRYMNFEFGYDLVIQVCSLVREDSGLDYAIVNMFVDRGGESPSCDGPELLVELASDTATPTAFPTGMPAATMGLAEGTFAPTSAPMKGPTNLRPSSPSPPPIKPDNLGGLTTDGSGSRPIVEAEKDAEESGSSIFHSNVGLAGIVAGVTFVVFSLLLLLSRLCRRSFVSHPDDSLQKRNSRHNRFAVLRKEEMSETGEGSASDGNALEDDDYIIRETPVAGV